MTVPAGSPVPPQAKVSAGSPAAILGVIPHLLGFTPESSLVVIGVEQPGAVKVTLRYDLPDPAAAELATDVAEHAVSVLASQRITAAVAVGYGPDHLVGPVVSAFAEAAGTGGIELRESLRTDEGRYWSYSCHVESCCPAEGTPLGTASQVMTGTLTESSGQVLTSRAALATTVAPLRGPAAESMRAATSRAEQHITTVVARLGRSSRPGEARKVIASEGLAAVSEMIALYRGDGRFSTDCQVAWLTVVLKDLRVRDDAWSRMDPEHHQAHQRMWTDVVRRAQPGYVAPAASLLAFVAWQAGNGALANVALDRALADDRDYSMAQLLRQVIAAGAPPSLARLPMTPEDVAESYDGLAAPEADQDEDADGDVPEDDEEADGQLQPAGVTA
jgi:hypothetical protein